MAFHLFQSTLTLKNGYSYQGWSFCNQSDVYGEIVFNTGMTGYQEIMTDPSYYNQIILFTYPEIGNTGINRLDYESSQLHVKGIVAKEICLYPSNWRSTISLPEYLIKHKIPHIFGIDTRSLAKYLRTHGIMLAIISANNNQAVISRLFFKDKLTNTKQLANYVTTDKINLLKAQVYKPVIYSYLDSQRQALSNHTKKLTVVLIDFGVKFNIVKRLLVYGCNVVILPMNSTYELICSHKPDGILLSNGPGDPSTLKFVINTVRQLVMYANIPIFGICMGHQVLSLALKAKTFKLKFGHRGLNHPSGFHQVSEITSQNHGFAVSCESSQEFLDFVQISHLNLNDLTIAGLFHIDKPIFSVQYHPEASPGPHDSDYLFKYFIHLLVAMKVNL